VTPVIFFLRKKEGKKGENSPDSLVAKRGEATVASGKPRESRLGQVEEGGREGRGNIISRAIVGKERILQRP